VCRLLTSALLQLKLETLDHWEGMYLRRRRRPPRQSPGWQRRCRCRRPSVEWPVSSGRDGLIGCGAVGAGARAFNGGRGRALGCVGDLRNAVAGRGGIIAATGRSRGDSGPLTQRQSFQTMAWQIVCRSGKYLIRFSPSEIFWHSVKVNIAHPQMFYWRTETELRTDSLHQSSVPVGLTWRC